MYTGAYDGHWIYGTEYNSDCLLKLSVSTSTFKRENEYMSAHSGQYLECFTIPPQLSMKLQYFSYMIVFGILMHL